MGQQQSRTKSGSVIIVDNFPTYDDKVRGGNINSIVNNEDATNNLDSFCCVKNPKKNSDDNKWKKMMIEQLDSLELEIWPKSLSKFLKKYDSDAGLPFQEDVAYAYRNHMVASAKRTMLMQSVYTQSNAESFAEDPTKRSLIESKSILQLSERKYADEAVQGILESSHILDEKFYDSNNKETWMSKSFNITPEHTQAINESVRKLKTNKPVKNSFKKTPKLPEVYMNSGRLSGGTKKHIEKYKHNTFINQLPISGRPDMDEADDLYLNIRKYKTVTEKIEQHTKHKRNVFFQLTEQFTSYLLKTYNPILIQAKKGEVPIGILVEYVEKVTTDVQQFIRIIFEGLCSYYRLDVLEEIIEGKETLFTRDNLINFTTSIVFTRSIYELVFEFYKLEEAEAEKEYQKNLKLCKTMQPQDFGVPDEYCLNEVTLKYFVSQGLLLKQIIEKNASPKNAENDGFYLDYSVSFEEHKLSHQSIQDTLTKRNSMLPEDNSEDLLNILLEKYNKSFKDIQPFSEGIKVLQNLKHRQSPIHKLKSIVKVAEIISKSIERFYGDFGLVNGKKLDADQTLSMFLYIVAKSGLCDIVPHCRIIERFSTNNVLHSVSGYYATTLQACVNCIQTMSFQDNHNPNRLGEGFKEMMRSVKLGSAENPSEPEKESSE